MSEEKVKFVSKHGSMTIMRKAIETTRSVNGVMQIVKEDQVPFKFVGGELLVTEEEAKEIRKKRGFGSLYEEVPKAVLNVANAKKDVDPEDENPDPKDASGAKGGDEDPEPTPEPKQPEVNTTVVDSVSNFNEASNYLKENFGLEHKDVNTKDKVFEHAGKLALEFPNYPDEE